MIKKLVRNLFLSLLIYFNESIIAQTTVFETTIFIRNHQFLPSIIEAPQKTKIRLTICNEDPTVEEFDSVDLKREKIIPGNTCAHIMLAPLAVGRYDFIGEFHSDTAKGCLVVN